MTKALIYKRLQALESLKQFGQMEKKSSPEELLEHFEKVYELQPGSLPRTAEEAGARGYSCMAEAMAGAIGLTLKEFKQMLQA